MTSSRTRAGSPASVVIDMTGVPLHANVTQPPDASHGVVIFAHGSGSSRLSPRNRGVAVRLVESGFTTVLLDLLTADEDRRDRITREYRFDIPRLAGRLVAATDWFAGQPNAGLAIAKSNDASRAWYDDGTTSIGTGSDLDAYDAPTNYSVPRALAPAELAGIALARNGRAYAWTRSGTVSAGTGHDLGRALAPHRYSVRRKTVQSYYEEISRGAFSYTEAGVSGWLRARDDPATSGVDEASRAFIYGPDEQGKGAWLIREVARRTGFRFADHDNNPRDGRVTARELGILWIYLGAAARRSRSRRLASREMTPCTRGTRTAAPASDPFRSWHAQAGDAFTGDVHYRFSVTASKAGYQSAAADCTTRVILNPP